MRAGIWGLTAMAVASGISSATAETPVALYPPYIYPSSYEHLNRWCGSDGLIINGADGQILLRLDQIEQGVATFNDPIDPSVVASGSERASWSGCLLTGKFTLTYWQTSGYLSIHRLQKDANAWWTADTFHRKEYVRLPDGFQGWMLNGDNLFATYVRPCPGQEAGASASCLGVERINLNTLDRNEVLERRRPAPEEGRPGAEIGLLQGTSQVTAVVAGEKETSFCRIDPVALTKDCRIALNVPVGQGYEDEYQRLTIGEDDGGFYEVGERLLYCQRWIDNSADSKPMCRVVSLRAEGDPGATLRLRAALPDGHVLVQADQCLSLGQISEETGIVRSLQCLLASIRSVVPDNMRELLVAQKQFDGEQDGITIPAWDMSVSPTGKWIAIQVPQKDCGNHVPPPETSEPIVGIAICGQVMIWRLDHFLR